MSQRLLDKIPRYRENILMKKKRCEECGRPLSTRNKGPNCYAHTEGTDKPETVGGMYSGDTRSPRARYGSFLRTYRTYHGGYSG